MKTEQKSKPCNQFLLSVMLEDILLSLMVEGRTRYPVFIYDVFQSNRWKYK